MSPAQPAPPPPQTCRRRGGGVPGEVGAGRVAPAGVPQSCLLAASSAFAKLQRQQPAGPGGRVQLGCANFDTRAFCEEAAAS